MFIREMEARLGGETATEINYFAFEKTWSEQRSEYSTLPSGDPVATAAAMFVKTSN
jgi:hypothetical protein